ncbi:MAG TPA: DUF1223 domain-containing protein [Methylophilus sp.]
MRIVTAAFFALCLPSALAAECAAKSAAHTVPLLELYTSEGCSSCPPADKWLSSLNVKPTEVTPLAFHVDYWDYIGWKDTYSKAEYSTRQRKMAAFNFAGFIYTPQFLLSGKDFKGWDNTRLIKSLAIAHTLPARAQLALSASTAANGNLTLNASATATDDVKNADVFVAIYENKLVSQVNAGENNGRELKHDYVVREFFGAYPMNSGKQLNKQFNLSKLWKTRDAGAVIFVQDASSGEILQSLALKFCS